MEYQIAMRIAIAGNVDSGKSTTTGVLQSNCPDDGNGFARKSVFNYPHEIISGRTSSVAQRTIYLDNQEIRKKIIVYDMAGHQKYLRTTLYGFTFCKPHMALILIECEKGINKMTKEHILTAYYLDIPILFVITKMDMLGAQNKSVDLEPDDQNKTDKSKSENKIPKTLTEKYKKTITDILSLSKVLKKKVFEIKSEKDVNLCVSNFKTIYPIIKISNVDLTNPKYPIQYLKQYLTQISTISRIYDISNNQNTQNPQNTEYTTDTKQPNINQTIFMIEKSFAVKGFPLIASGYMKSGVIKLNQNKSKETIQYYIGPFGGFNPQLYPITIRSIHDDDKHTIDILRMDEVGCVAFSSVGNLIANKKLLRSGMIITDNPKLNFYRYFTASVNIIPGNHTTLKKDSMLFIHCNMIRQSVFLNKIIYANKEVDIARYNCNQESIYTIHFEFATRSNYLSVGDIFLFREGKIHGCGTVLSLSLTKF